MYVLFYEAGGTGSEAPYILNRPCTEFIALATLIADKHAPGTQTVIGGPQTSL
jgi:hypothetical protein